MFSTNYVFAYIAFLLAHMTSLFSSGQWDKHASLKEQWHQIQSLNTGYVNENPEMSTSLADMSNRQLRQAIIWKFEQLKCSYLFSAHFHFSMVRKLHLEADCSRLNCKLPWMKSILFVLETEQMFRSLFYFKDRIKMEEVWLVYRYAYKLYYIHDVFKNKRHQQYMIDNRTEFLRMHDFFVTNLETYLETNCEHDNFFNIKSNSCVYYKENEYYLKNNKSPEIALMNVIKCNTKLFRLFYDNNIKKGLGNFVKNEITDRLLKDTIFSVNKYQNYRSVLEYFCRLFLGLDDWVKLATTENVYQMNLIRAAELSSLLYRGKYNARLSDIFKVCMLRIVWLYLTELNATENNFLVDEERFNKYFKGLSSTVTVIVNALNLNHDDFLYELERFLRLDLIHYKNNINQMMKDIEYNHKSISIALGLQHSNDIPGFHSLQAKRLFNKKDKFKPGKYNKIHRLDIIMAELLKAFKGRFKEFYNNEVFNSYMQFNVNKERSMDKFILRKKSDKHVIRLEFV